jgi:hypothetical protein
MLSIIKPLNDIVIILTKDMNTVMQKMRSGQPYVNDEVDKLASDIAAAKANFKSVVSSMYASFESSVATAQGLTNPSPMLQVITFFAQEAGYAVQLLANLMKLIANLVTLQALLSYFTQDIEAAQKWVNKKVIWLNKSVTRTKQKSTKNIEWSRRETIATSNLTYYTRLQQDLEKQISDLQTNQNSKDSTLVKDKNAAIAATQIHLAEVKRSIEAQKLELNYSIPSDKKLWGDKWKAEAEKDRKDMLGEPANA